MIRSLPLSVLTRTLNAWARERFFQRLAISQELDGENRTATNLSFSTHATAD